MPLFPLASSAWTFRDTSTKSWLPATVPGCVHTDLIAAGKIPDPFHGTNELDLQWIEERDWEYRTTFTLPATAGILAEEVVELVADGLDTVATVFLNGEKIAETENMFIGHRWEVRHHLRAGRNELRVRFRSALDYIRNTRADFIAPKQCNDPVGNCVRIRKQQCQFGWDWGPRFVSAGIWRDLHLDAWSGNRLTHVQIAQRHAADGSVALHLTPELARPVSGDAVTHVATVSLGGREVARAEFAQSAGATADADTGVGPTQALAIPRPELWWPAGQGAQPLYDLVFTSRDVGGRVLGVIRKRVGLRTLVLDQTPDAEGKKFQFVVNDRPVFVKGANWIPANSFVTGLTRADYARDLRAAVQAHMNGVRVWGGGIYESEDFYDLCDELGLLIWHDFMFACDLYPADAAFLHSVRTEARGQLRRLHHRAAIALWCGNNELVQINGDFLRANPSLRAGYEALFHGVLAEVAAAHAPDTAYRPTSEWRETFDNGHEHGVREGDTHYWDVWHARHPVKDYEKWRFRFCSEFGMQSYSSPATNATFAPPGEDNVFGAVMENHQKNRAGNQIILDYVSRRYRFPKSQDALIVLSQLNQAYCMQIGVEHYRRTMPHCMGAIYWQLNDCWPVASWSSIEFTGRWKALHHIARRFNAPALVSAHVPGDEAPITGNYRRSTVREVHLYTVYDAPTPAAGVLRWDLFHLDGRVVLSGKKKVALRHNEALRQHTLDLAKPLAAHGRDVLYLRIALVVDGAVVSQETVFLTAPRFLDLPRGKVKSTVRAVAPREFEVTFTSAVFQHRFHFDVPGAVFTASDNFFELYPGEAKTVQVAFARKATAEGLRKQLVTASLADTYA